MEPAIRKLRTGLYHGHYLSQHSSPSDDVDSGFLSARLFIPLDTRKQRIKMLIMVIEFIEHLESLLKGLIQLCRVVVFLLRQPFFSGAFEYHGRSIMVKVSLFVV